MEPHPLFKGGNFILRGFLFIEKSNNYFGLALCRLESSDQCRLSHIYSTVPLALNEIISIEIFCVTIFLSILQTYVRDIYPFRRSVSPQLNLVHMLPEKGQELIQKQVRLEM